MIGLGMTLGSSGASAPVASGSPAPSFSNDYAVELDGVNDYLNFLNTSDHPIVPIDT